MKKYMSYCSQFLSHKNKLEEAVKNFIKDNDRKIIDEKDAAKFRVMISDGILELNKKFPRCTPLKASFWKSPISSEKDIHMDGIDCARFTLMACEEVAL